MPIEMDMNKEIIKALAGIKAMYGMTGHNVCVTIVVRHKDDKSETDCVILSDDDPIAVIKKMNDTLHSQNCQMVPVKSRLRQDGNFEVQCGEEVNLGNIFDKPGKTVVN